jgi:hypothetical protein
MLDQKIIETKKLIQWLSSKDKPYVMGALKKASDSPDRNLFVPHIMRLISKRSPIDVRLLASRSLCFCATEFTPAVPEISKIIQDKSDDVELRCTLIETIPDSSFMTIIPTDSLLELLSLFHRIVNDKSDNSQVIKEAKKSLGFIPILLLTHYSRSYNETAVRSVLVDYLKFHCYPDLAYENILKELMLTGNLTFNEFKQVCETIPFVCKNGIQEEGSDTLSIWIVNNL